MGGQTHKGSCGDPSFGKGDWGRFKVDVNLWGCQE